MKVTIKDPDALNSITHGALIEFLERTGWEHSRDEISGGDGVTVIYNEWKFFSTALHRTFYVRAYPDGYHGYTAKMAENFMTIEQATDVSQLQIYADIVNDAVVFLPSDLSNFEINLDMSKFASAEVTIGDEEDLEKP